MPQSIAPADIPRLLKPGMTVYVQGTSGETPLFADALRAVPDAAAGVRFTGVWLPGYNRIDYAALHPDARSTVFFVGPDLRSSFEAGHVAYKPLTYFGAYGHLRDDLDIDVALLHLSPPDNRGRLSLGLCSDFAPAVVDKATVKVAHVNPNLPQTHGLVDVGWDDLDYIIETPGPVAGDDGKTDASFLKIGAHLAELVPDGATLEVGIGGVQSVLPALAGKRDLRIHSGAVSDTLLPLLEAGSIDAAEGAVTAGMAWSGGALHRFCAEDPRMRFAPVGWTHDISRLRAIERFVAINAVIEVDLLGQANAEMIGGRQVSSAGGLTDFMRGARLSPGGFSVVALPSTARRGSVSRIVSALAPDSAVGVARTDMDMVATEHGVADLRGLDVDARARALIAVADPAFRDHLAAAWDERRRRM